MAEYIERRAALDAFLNELQKTIAASGDMNYRQI